MGPFVHGSHSMCFGLHKNDARWSFDIFSFPLGIEARGFIFGPSIALALGAKFVPLRKPKKLPGNNLVD